MALFVDSSGAPKQYEIPAEGAAEATLVEVRDLGWVETRFGSKRRVRFTWELAQLNSEGFPYRVFSAYNLSFDPKSALYKAVRSILGREPEKRFDLETLVGSKVTLVIQHYVAEAGKTYANVAAVIRQGAGGAR